MVQVLLRDQRQHGIASSYRARLAAARDVRDQRLLAIRDDRQHAAADPLGDDLLVAVDEPRADLGPILAVEHPEDPYAALVRRGERLGEMLEVLGPDGDVELLCRVADDEAAVLADRVEPGDGQYLARRLEGGDGGKRLLEVLDRLLELAAETMDELVRRDADVLGSGSRPHRMDDALRREPLESRVHLRRRDPGRLGHLVAVLRSMAKEPEIDPRLVERHSEHPQPVDDAVVHHVSSVAAGDRRGEMS
jgi:hypothetical protein